MREQRGGTTILDRDPSVLSPSQNSRCKKSEVSLPSEMLTHQSCLYLLFLLFPSSVECWGKIGHEIVGNLAWSLLSERAQSAVERILQTNNTSPQTVGPSKTNCQEFCSPLAEIANWADQVRYTSYYHWSGPLHFIDIRDDQIRGRCSATNSSDCHFDYNRDCPDSFCVAGSVVNYTHRIEEEPQLVTKRDSLKFLVHFVGDIHQVGPNYLCFPCTTTTQLTQCLL